MKTAEDILKGKSQKIVYVPENTVIQDVISQMVQQKIGAMLVKKEGQYVGIWTERDLLRNSLEPKFDLKTSTIGEYMDTKIVSAPGDTTIEKLQDMYLGLFIRHILIIRGLSYLGLLSIGDVLRALLLEKDKEIKELNQIAGWEYYENWGWHCQYQQKEDSSKE
jgi:CBS domain-containing protein